MTRHLMNPLRLPTTPRPNATRLDLVRLDDRLTPSAAAGVSGGVLSITGDAGDNEITFTRMMTKGSTRAENVRVLDFGHVVGTFPLTGLTGLRFDGGGGTDSIASNQRLPRLTDTTAAIEGGVLFVRGDAGDNPVRLEQSGLVTKGSRERDIDVYDGDYRVATFPTAALRGVTGVRFDGGPGVDTLSLGRTGLTRLTGTAAGVSGGVLSITGDAGDNDITFNRLVTKGSRFGAVDVLDHGRSVGRFSLEGVSGYRFDGGGGDDTVEAHPQLPRLTDTTATVENGVLFVRGDAGDNAVRLERTLTKGSKAPGIDVYDGLYKVASFTAAAIGSVTGVRFEGGPGTDTDTLSLGRTGLPRLSGAVAGVAEGLLQITGDAGDNEVVLQRMITKGRGVSVRVLDHGQDLGVFPLAGLAGVRFNGGEGTDSIATGPWLPRVTDTTAAIENGVLFIRGDAGDNAVRVAYSGGVTKGSRERDISVYDGDYRVATFSVAAVRGITGVRFEGGPGIDTLANSTSLARLTGTTVELRWPDTAPPVSSLTASKNPAPIEVIATAPDRRHVEAEATVSVAFDFHGASLSEAPPTHLAAWRTLDLAEHEVDDRDGQ